jgi:hypothetical protein
MSAFTEFKPFSHIAIRVGMPPPSRARGRDAARFDADWRLRLPRGCRASRSVARPAARATTAQRTARSSDPYDEFAAFA